MSDSSSEAARAASSHAASSHAASSHAASSHAPALASGKSAKRHARKRKINAALAEGTHHFGAAHDDAVVGAALSKRRRGSAEFARPQPGLEHLATPWPCHSNVIAEWEEFQTVWRAKVALCKYVPMLRQHLKMLSVWVSVGWDGVWGED